MIKSEVSIHLLNAHLCIFINGEHFTAKQCGDALPYLEEAVGLIGFEPTRGHHEKYNITDAVLHEIQHYSDMFESLYSTDDFRVHFSNVKRKIIDCIPIFRWMEENPNQLGKLYDGNIELIEMGNY